MSKEWAESQLNAGGFVGLDVQVDESATETMIARTYCAPVLGDRVVIRLTSERLVPAEDLSMEFLGLEGRAISRPIAKQHRSALEFGHWALIHQPQHARYALDLVKRMKAAARKAVSKAGHAWDLYVAMAEELNKSVRHFLPTFWEQAARAYKELGNTTYAGRALAKALEAERVHSLKVDREHRRDAILEFTLSGCLSGKALTEYARDLETQFPPLEAYETYKDLIVRRTMGGMAPLANCAVDLVRMAKAAGLDASAQIEAVLEAIIVSPAMSRAPLQFWRSVKQQVHNIVMRNPAFALRLLVHTNPTSSYSSDSAVWDWLDLLDEWQVLPYLSMPADELPQNVEIPGGRAGWFSRLASVETSPNKRVFELLEQMADVIRAEQQPLQMGIGYNKVLDVDLLDMALDLGIDVGDPEEGEFLSFDGWFRETIDHPRRNSQLTHVYEDERFRPKLVGLIPELVKFQGDRKKESWGRTLAPRRSFEDAAAGHPTIEKAWWEFIEKQLKALESGGLADFEIAEEKLSSCCRAKTAELFPDLVVRLKQIDFGDCLHRTLVAGVFDEYGWEQLDRIADAHPVPQTTRHGERSVYWAYPQMSWRSQDTVHFVAPSSYSTCDIVLTKSQRMLFAVQVGSQYALVYYDSDAGWKAMLRWSGDPNQNFEQTTGHYVYRENWESVVPYGTDGIFAGERVFREGDKVIPTARQNWYHDGQRFWKITGVDAWDGRKVKLAKTVCEIDPLTGKTIRESVPPFFEEHLPPSAEVELRQSHLMIKPQQEGTSPLGERNGLIGLRCVRRRDGALESVGIDGRAWVFTKEEQPTKGMLAAVGIMNKPASKSFWILASDGRLIDSETRCGFGLYVTKGKYFAGTPCELPLRFMHSMRIRSEKTSRALRALSRTDADKLLAAGEAEREALRQKLDENNPDLKRTEASRVAASIFPDAPPRLVQGIARIARVAADEKVAIQSILNRLMPTESVRVPSFDPAIADEGFQEMVLDQPSTMVHHYQTAPLSHHLQQVAQYFAGDPLELTEKVRQYWFSLVEDLPSVLWRSFWKYAIQGDEKSSLKQRLQGKWLHAMRALAQSGLLELPGSFAFFRCSLESQTEKLGKDILERLKNDQDTPLTDGASRYIAYPFFSYPHRHIYLLGYSAKGECKPPKKFVIDEAKKIDIKWKQKQIVIFINALSKLETLPLPSVERLNAAANRLGLHPISVFLLWGGNLRRSIYGIGQEKLSKEIRDFYGWKVKEIQIAVAELQDFHVPEGLFSDCLKDPSYLLTGAGHNFDAMVNTLAEAKRAVIPFPPEICQALDRAFGKYFNVPMKEFNELVTAPQDAELLKLRKLDFKLMATSRGYKALTADLTPSAAFDGFKAYWRLPKALALINYKLPVGHTIRRLLPQAIEAVRAFLDHPEAQLLVGHEHLPYGTDQAMDVDQRHTAAPTLGKFELDAHGFYRSHSDYFIIAEAAPQILCFFRPSRLKTQKDLQVMTAAIQTMWPGEVYPNHYGNFSFVISMRSAAMSQLAASNREPTVAEGLWEQNPHHSVPKTVAACAKKLKLDELSAALYLQLLALPDPTFANLKLWNGWNNQQIQAAAKALVEKELVVQAKRERAGRDLFLPGGWEPLKAPNLPIETWKLSLFGYENNDRFRGYMAEFIVFEGAIPTLFELAWQRILAGDVPAYGAAPK